MAASAVDVAEKARKRNEIEIHREQHQFDAHQEENDVLTVQEQPGDRNREQDPGQGEHVGEADHGRFSELILTILIRSFARTATCLAMSCGLPPVRCRKVSTIAATLATNRTRAAISAG